MDISSVSKLGVSAIGQVEDINFQKEYDSFIASHKGEKNHHRGSVKKIQLALNEGRDRPLCINLCEMPDILIFLPKLRGPFATIAYLAKAMA